MRLSPLFLLALTGSLLAGEASYPLWDGSESVADYAKRVNLPPTQTLDLGNNVKLELVLIPAGKFNMGTSEPEKPAVGQAMVGMSGGVLLLLVLIVLIRARLRRRRPQFSLASLLVLTLVASVGVWGGVRWNEALKHPDRFICEHPTHAVTLTRPFYMGKYDVTQQQYEELTGLTPSTFKGKDKPVDTVSWDDAHVFCKKLTDQTGQNVRLPTEAEWEYACQAGSATTCNSGDNEAGLDKIAWYSANGNNTTHPVGQKNANNFGLYDLIGNLFQWCEDWYGEDYYGKSEAENPQGPAQGYDRVMRGGSWDAGPLYCRPAYRGWNRPGYRRNGIGFRIVVTPAPRTP